MCGLPEGHLKALIHTNSFTNKQDKPKKNLQLTAMGLFLVLVTGLGFAGDFAVAGKMMASYPPPMIVMPLQEAQGAIGGSLTVNNRTGLDLVVQFKTSTGSLVGQFGMPPTLLAVEFENNMPAGLLDVCVNGFEVGTLNNQ